jgi:hypothetical protein
MNKKLFVILAVLLFSVNVVSAQIINNQQTNDPNQIQGHTKQEYENALAKERAFVKGDTGYFFTESYLKQAEYLVILGRLDEAIEAYNTALAHTFIDKRYEQEIRDKRNNILQKMRRSTPLEGSWITPPTRV